MTSPLRRTTAAVLVVLAMVSVLTGADPRDDWPRYAHDGALTGRTSLEGDIISPRVAWSYAVGGRELTIELMPANGHNSLVIPGDGDVTTTHSGGLTPPTTTRSPSSCSRRSPRSWPPSPNTATTSSRPASTPKPSTKPSPASPKPPTKKPNPRPPEPQPAHCHQVQTAETPRRELCGTGILPVN